MSNQKCNSLNVDLKKSPFANNETDIQVITNIDVNKTTGEVLGESHLVNECRELSLMMQSV